jgi:hypothetical protein
MKNITLTAIVVLFVGFGCGINSNDYSYDSGERHMPVMAYDMAKQVESANPAEVVDASRPMGQMLIKTISIGIEVVSYEKARQQVDSLAKIFGAWVSRENMYNSDYRISTDLTIRVPADNLDKLNQSLIAIAKKVEYQNIEVADVTEEYIDVESRLKNHKALEQKYINLLRKAESMEDILKIEGKLAEVRSHIESIEGRKRYLDGRVTFSSINLNFFQRVDYKYTPEPMDNFWQRLVKALDKGWKGFVLFLLFLIRLWPFWILTVLVWFLYRTIRKRRRIKKQQPSKHKDKKQKSKEKKKSDNQSPDEVV